MKSIKSIIITILISLFCVLLNCIEILTPEEIEISNELNILNLSPANGSTVKWGDQLVADIEVITNNFDTSNGYKYFVYITEIDSNGEESNIGNVGEEWLYFVTKNVDTIKIKYGLSSNFSENPHDINSIYNIYYSKSNNLSQGMATLAKKQIKYLKDHSNDPP